MLRIQIKLAAIFAVLLASSGVATAEVVANLGILPLNNTQVVTCNTEGCTATWGTVGGSLPTNTPGADPFQHQIAFRVPSVDVTLASTQFLDSTAFDTANLTVSLFQYVSGSTSIGGTATGTLLATATKSTFAGTTNFFLQIAGLSASLEYFIEIVGGGQGVTKPSASYAQQIAQYGGPPGGPSPVPIPAPFLLLGFALGGLGLVRWLRSRNAATAA